jgi:hypothetical protein
MKFPVCDFSIGERLVKVVGHRELGDLAELAGAAAVARCAIAVGVRSGAAGPGAVSRTLDCGWVVMWSTYAAASGSPETLSRNFSRRR